MIRSSTIWRWSMSVKLTAEKRLIWCRVTVVVTGLLFVAGLVTVVAHTPFLVTMSIFALCFVALCVLMYLDNRPNPVRRQRYFNE